QRLERSAIEDLPAVVLQWWHLADSGIDAPLRASGSVQNQDFRFRPLGLLSVGFARRTCEQHATCDDAREQHQSGSAGSRDYAHHFSPCPLSSTQTTTLVDSSLAVGR